MTILAGRNQYRWYFDAATTLCGFWGFALVRERNGSRLLILRLRVPCHGFAIRLWGNKHLHRFFMHFRYDK